MVFNFMSDGRGEDFVDLILPGRNVSIFAIILVPRYRTTRSVCNEGERDSTQDRELARLLFRSSGSDSGVMKLDGRGLLQWSQ